jgi:hypothetical protein
MTWWKIKPKWKTEPWNPLAGQQPDQAKVMERKLAATDESSPLRSAEMPL